MKKSEQNTILEYKLRSVRDEDGQAVLDIFNRFAHDSYAVYSDQPLDMGFFLRNREKAKAFYIVETGDQIVGFGYLKPFREYDNFNHTTMLTYFIQPEHTGKGLGTLLYQRLIQDGKARGVTNYIAHISSRNEQSLAFHRKHGFQEVGRLKNMGTKFGELFDIVWVQKQIEDAKPGETT